MPVGSTVSDVAIVGAGPYGLSLAAHLRRQGVAFRIFGRPMANWRDRMPRGMFLKSEPFASNLYDPDRSFTLREFCKERGLAYSDVGVPVSLDTFCAYGIAFQERLVPDLDTRLVTSVRESGGTFAVRLDDGEELRFRRVIVAVGISHFDYLPDDFAHLPATLLSHSANVGDMSRFAGKRVVVIGGGASAIDSAISIADAGADVHLVTRRPKLGFHAAPKKRTVFDRVTNPMSTVGPGWKGTLVTRLPLVFHRLSEKFRFDAVRRFLGPAPCWFTREPFEQKVKLHASTDVQSITAGQRAVLALRTQNGTNRLEADHIVAATGYRVDLRRLRFLDPSLLSLVRQTVNTPILSRQFESSVPGLFFVGVAAANSFGPLLRFACGAEFTAKHLSRYLARTAPQHDPVPNMVSAGGWAVAQNAD